jgi:outer membrane protein OmpA-like peptidoglycan-associated protein
MTRLALRPACARVAGQGWRRLAPTAVALFVVTGTPSPARADAGPFSVLGSTPVQASRSAAKGLGTALVHGVRRIPGGTVLYFSYGLPSEAGAGNYNWFDRTEVVSTYGVLGPVLVDAAGAKVYAALKLPGGRRVETDLAANAAAVGGGYSVLWTVMPELPASTTSVDVVLGQGEVISGVPVESGPMTPTVPGRSGVPLGTGWPEVDAAQVSAGSGAGSVFALEIAVSTLDNSTTTRTSQSQVSVDLSADVLFDVDRASLTSGAAAKIQAAAKLVNEAAAPGTVTVVGHTDSTGTSAHNLDLSQRRAAAVAAALNPLLTVTGLTVTVLGKGEAEPVATNDTAAGRQQNRRVSIRFTKASS